MAYYLISDMYKTTKGIHGLFIEICDSPKSTAFNLKHSSKLGSNSVERKRIACMV